MLDQKQKPLGERKVMRRGLLAGLAGLGAVALMHVKGTPRAEADDPNDITIGQQKTGTAETRLTASGTVNQRLFQVVNGGVAQSGRGAITGIASGGGVSGVHGVNQDASGIGVRAESTSGTGLRATSTTGFGIQARTSSSLSYAIRGVGANGTGVLGVSNNGGEAELGDGSGIGVHGLSGSGTGVVGESSLGATGFGMRGFAQQNGTGVKGVSNNGGNLSTNGTGSGIGVEGRSGSGPGVHGQSVSSLGVRGVSTNFVGVVGISTNNHGLYGSTSALGAVGLVGENLGGGLAGYFNGNVQVTGNFQVFGAKNAIIKMQDGTFGSVYCQESPEPYFEDFGKAQLAGGVASVALEREFATLVAGDEYLVFLTPEGDTRGLFVSRKGTGGFEVREVKGGTGDVPFAYRIVTKRKDIEGKRFARVNTDAAQSVAGARAVLAAMATAGPSSGLPVGPSSGPSAPLPTQQTVPPTGNATPPSAPVVPAGPGSTIAPGGPSAGR